MGPFRVMENSSSNLRIGRQRNRSQFQKCKNWDNASSDRQTLDPPKGRRFAKAAFAMSGTRKV
jgi:hypothetical protein